MPYDLEQHRHNFSIWTAARSVQRGWAGSSTANIKSAIEVCGMRQFALDIINQKLEDFDLSHRSYALKLIASLRNQGVSDVSYGRAAKIIAIYLKTSVVLQGGLTNDTARMIHPPIDDILLTRIRSINLHLKDLGKPGWTKLNQKGYWGLVEKIKVHYKFDWTLEEYWTPERD